MKTKWQSNFFCAFLPNYFCCAMWIQTYFQNNSFTRNDIDKYFDNKTQNLSRCESISFPTLEILDKERPKESGHYWLLVLKIRDSRFEALDSARTLKDKAFMSRAKKSWRVSRQIGRYTTAIQVCRSKIGNCKKSDAQGRRTAF